MLASIKNTSTFLLCFILQSSCWGIDNSSISSVEQDIGRLADAALYAEKLEPGSKNKIFFMLKDHLFYKRFLKKIGADSNLLPMELAPDQQKQWHKVYLLFIDLYRVSYKALESVMMDSDSLDNVSKAYIELSELSLQFMQKIFSTDLDVDNFMNRNEQQLWTTIKQHYIIPFNEYLDGGNWRTFEASVDIGRIKTYQSLKVFLKECPENLPDETVAIDF